MPFPAAVPTVNRMDPKQRIHALTQFGVPMSVAQRWVQGQAEDGKEAPADPSSAGEGEVMVMGVIVDAMTEDFFGGWVGEEVLTSSRAVRRRLKEVPGDVLVRINSPGGDVWEGSAIHGLLLERANSGATVNVMVEGLAASAASFIMLAGGKITAYPLADFMIHEARLTCHYATATDLERFAKSLRSTNSTLAGLYAARCDLTEAAALQALADETWYSATAARDIGLIDEILNDGGKNEDGDGAGDGGEGEGEEKDDVAAISQRNLEAYLAVTA